MNSDSNSYSRGQLASLTELNPETIRYYERVGLLPKPERSENNYRIYRNEHVDRLRFIRRARGLGFETQTIRDLIDGESLSICSEVKQRTLDHIEEIEQKISELKQIKKQLSNLVTRCDSNTMQSCPIVRVLSSED